MEMNFCLFMRTSLYDCQFLVLAFSREVGQKPIGYTQTANSGWKEDTMSKVLTRAKQEFLEVLPTTIFFLFAFHVITLTNALMLREHGINITNQAAATIGALLVAKVVLIADKLSWINKFPNQPLMYNVAWKTLIYVGGTLVVRFVEHLLPFLWDHESFGLAVHHLFGEIVWSHFWAIQIWLLVLFLVYSAGRELVRALGSEHVLDIFFRRSVLPNP